MPTKKNWQEKLANDNGLPIVKSIPHNMKSRWGMGTIAIPAPREVDAIMRKVPRGKLITIHEIRQEVAALHKATTGCPITTGIFAWIAAHAAAEMIAEGKKRITPYWRTLKSKGELNPKYPGGIEGVKAQLEAEGHTVVSKGKRYFVENYEQRLV